uniref:alanine/glycine:cation symporter family protein n=1 Tax=Acidaminococcus timonensis TaxID=1871002 RepID=UPI0025F714CC
PMYYIENGLGRAYRPLAIAFAFFGVLVAYFGIGTFAQVNSIVQITQLNAGIPVEYTAVVLTILVAAITLGGLQSIAKTASKVVPAMAIIYMASTLGFLVIFADKVPGAILEIFYDAFHPTAAVGGFLGASVLFAMRNGVARGVFSNESGLGSAPIVAAAAKTKWPAEQGLVSMTGTFIDTIIICTMTGLVVVISGLWKGDLNGAALTNAAFLQAYPHFGGYMLMVGLVLFAFTTILGWNYYGERCMEYLVGTKGIMPYRIVFIILVGCGAFLKLEAIWILADIVNGLMAIPNLIALLGLSGVVVAETKKYLQHEKEEDEEEAAKQ